MSQICTSRTKSTAEGSQGIFLKPSPRFGVVVALGVLLLVTFGCTSTAPTSSPPGTSLPESSLGPTPSTTVVPPLSTPAQVNDATNRELDAAQQLNLDPEQRSCVATKLQADPILVAALGDKPAESDRWQDLLTLATDCINTITFSAQFAINLQGQSGNTLTSSQLDCVRHKAADWPTATVQQLIQAGLNPGTTIPALQNDVDGLLQACNISRSQLAQP